MTLSTAEPILSQPRKPGAWLMGCAPSRPHVTRLHPVQEAPQDIRPDLSTAKWQMLSDWTAWLMKDQFGWTQPALADIVGPGGRSKLSGHERSHDYQVAISFPGADFDKGSEGHRGDVTDHLGRLLASSGTEMAEALQQWLVEGWLGGDQNLGLSHVFVCSKNLRFVPGSVKAVNFRHFRQRGTEGAETGAAAVLNANWTMYLRESFLEARVVVFVINEDWMDSIACNQEFEAMVTRARRLTPSSRMAMVLMDITDDRFNRRWGAKLPQFKANLALEAGKHCDVFQFTYNQQTTAEDKARVQQEFVAVAAKYGTKHPGQDIVYRDLCDEAPKVNWPNWLYFGQLEGSNGWETLAEEPGTSEDGFSLQLNEVPVVKTLASRRFRLRVMGMTGDTFNEGFKYMCQPLLFYDAATGANIVAEGKGYWRASGERMGTLGFSHWCGPLQYSWIEWVVPGDMPAVELKSVDVRVNAQRWVVEAQPLAAWPGPSPETLQDYHFLGYNDTDTANVSRAAQPPKWVLLHQVQAGQAGLLPAQPLLLPATAPACKAFRLRITDTADGLAAGQVAASLSINVHYPEGLYPLGGGHIGGSGGNCAMEDAPPVFAFDGSDQTRWVDIDGGGIGNTSILVYEHEQEVVIEAYTITSQTYALSSYHSHLNGTPRDWSLKAWLSSTESWVVVDSRTHTYFTNHGETKRFQTAHPVAARKYMLEFTAVAAGCASRSIQVGGVAFFTRTPARVEALRQHQVVVLMSAYNSNVDAAAAKGSGYQLAPEYGVKWASPSQLEVTVPTHPGFGGHPGAALTAVQGGVLGWTLGPGRVANWYDHPVELLMEPRVNMADPDAAVETRGLLVVRPAKTPLLNVDHVHTISFRREYPDGEVELVYTHTRPFVLKAYSMRSGGNFMRGDPRSWEVHAETSPGSWVVLHRVINFHFPDRLAPLMQFCLGNQISAARYRLVVLEMNAMVGLLHFSDLVLYQQLCQEEQVGAAAADTLAVPRQEAAHLTLKLKPHEAEGGELRPVSYWVGPHADAQQAGTMPTAWVLEGLTSAY
ncbi:hypothetical protein V8C86DRAFT_2644588 [Haematococcus lacustris]